MGKGRFVPSAMWSGQQSRVWWALSAGLAVLAAWGFWRADVLQQRLQGLRLAGPSPAATMPRRGDSVMDTWARDWPIDLQTDRLLLDVTSVGQSLGVSVHRASLERPASPSTGWRQADVVVEFRATYPALKLWLRDLLSRHPSLAVVTLDLQADDAAVAPRAAERQLPVGTVRLRLHARPAPAPASGAGRS